MFRVAVAISGAASAMGGRQTAKLTQWGPQSNLIGAQCEYANPPVNSVTDSVLPKELRDGMHCAIDSAWFGNGERCGNCYNIYYKGKTVNVMVSNGGAGGGSYHFDCIDTAWKAITGAPPGVTTVEFEQTYCHGISGGPVIINWADKNAYYCRMMFENVGGWGTVDGVRACLGSKCTDLQRDRSAAWKGCPTGTGSSMKFTLRQKGHSIDCECKISWPWDHGKRCTCPTNFKVGVGFNASTERLV